jgi:hypothetical protein
MANKYRYPKGHPKAGQFQPAKEGARQFVRDNFDKITAGKVSVKTLSPTEKKIYAGLKGSDFGNRYNFGKQKFYDPTGKLKNIISPITKGSRDLKNFLSKDQVERFFSIPQMFADPENSRTFILGRLKDLQNYQTKSGQLLDIVKLAEKYQRKGFSLEVTDTFGEMYPNALGVERLTQFENDKIDEAAKISRRAQGKNPFIRLKIDYMPVINVYKKKIEINLNDVTVMDMSNS